jgi:uncharacterized membrane protein
MPISCPQCHAKMPDDVAFCPGCGLRMWVPGREVNKPATSPREARTPDVTMPVAVAPAPGVPVPSRDRLTAALAYVTFIFAFIPVLAIVFVLIEPLKRNRFVRFHSFQSIFFSVATILAAIFLRILYPLLALIPVVGYLLAWLSMAVAFLGWGILWLVLLVKALQGETFRLPGIGSLAEKA